jgi:hypothetical protein
VRKHACHKHARAGPAGFRLRIWLLQAEPFAVTSDSGYGAAGEEEAGEAEAVADAVSEGSPSSVTVAGCPTLISPRGRWVGHMPLCCPVRDLLPPPSPRASMMLLTHRRRSPSKRAGLAGHEESERRRRGSGYGEVAEADHGRRRHAHAPPCLFCVANHAWKRQGGGVG